MTIHDPRVDVNIPSSDRYENYFLTVYRALFGGDVKLEKIAGLDDRNKSGIDRIVFFKETKIRVEEKLRFFDRIGYRKDILLEHVSNDKRNTPGWMEKNLQCDFLLYCFEKPFMAFFLPWGVLKPVWDQYKQKWLALYGTKSAQNTSYNTISIPIPMHVVLPIIPGRVMVNITKTRGDIFYINGEEGAKELAQECIVKGVNL